MFTTKHFIWLGICVLMIGGLLWLSVGGRWSRRKASRVMAAMAAVSELSKIFTHIQPPVAGGGGVVEPNALPLHLCSMLIFLVFFCAFSRNDRRVGMVASFCTPVAIWGGVLANMMATSGVDFTDPNSYQCFLFHAALIWWALHMICMGQVDLGRRAYVRNLAALSGLAVVMLWVNSALSVYDTNFFFVVRPPVEGLPLLNLDHGWHVYFLTVVGIGLVALTSVHLPTMLRERRSHGKMK